MLLPALPHGMHVWMVWLLCMLIGWYVVHSLPHRCCFAWLFAVYRYLTEADCGALLHAITALLLTTSRLGQVNRCIASIDTLLEGIHALVKQRLLAAWELDQGDAESPKATGEAKRVVLLL